jgi:phage-related protein
MIGENARELAWIGSSYDDLKALPRPVQREFGIALRVAQLGQTPRRAKPLKGFGGAGVLEVIDDFDGDTFRAVYTVRLRHAVYVLHVFQKKSKRGRGLPKADRALIEARLRRAEQIDREGRAR